MFVEMEKCNCFKMYISVMLLVINGLCALHVKQQRG